MTEKLLILLLIACVITTVFSGCVQSSDGSESDITESESAVVEVSDFKIEEYKPEECDPEKDWKLIVNGEEIGYVKYNEEYNYAEIPMVVVLEKLGAEMEWHSATTVRFSLGGIEYMLYTSAGTMFVIRNGDFVDSSIDVLNIAPPGNVHPHPKFFKGVGKNFIVDSDFLKCPLANYMWLRDKSIEFKNV